MALTLGVTPSAASRCRSHASLRQVRPGRNVSAQPSTHTTHDMPSLDTTRHLWMQVQPEAEAHAPGSLGLEREELGMIDEELEVGAAVQPIDPISLRISTRHLTPTQKEADIAQQD
eukprot:29449-Rhodomonas_salina.1